MLSKDNIAIIISIISIAIHVWNFIEKFYKEHLKLNVLVHHSYDSRNTLALDISIVNKSKLPITISGIELIVSNGSKLLSSYCAGDSNLFVETTYKTIYFEQLPLSIPALLSTRGWFKFDTKDISLENDLSHYKCKLVLYCNNGKRKYKVLLPNSSKLEYL
ncbi:hypothetical protein KBI51_09585 [Aerococcaceae bacterium zg-ZUI334]|uniref:hypothetical protein n=1 Tax=Aerococcaceae bacterium zg-252 TaxID=2796928 RepID=UPI001B9A40B1|nr:hypothetical protein [Aerococcaceae bacterium zg-ZUI334]